MATWTWQAFGGDSRLFPAKAEKIEGVRTARAAYAHAMEQIRWRINRYRGNSAMAWLTARPSLVRVRAVGKFAGGVTELTWDHSL